MKDQRVTLGNITRLEVTSSSVIGGGKLLDVLAWAHNACFGERVIYIERTGTDIEDRQLPILVSAMKAHEAGLVFLAQRRTLLGWAYEATRISPVTARLLGIVPMERRVA